MLAFRISQDLTKAPLGRWSDKLPLPDVAPPSESENESVTTIFLGALGWILRHELAHIALKHQETDTTDRMNEDEFAADGQASRWLRGDRKKDKGRALGVRPSKEEVELEGLALRMGIGLMWVALFEEHHGGRSTDHPEIATRFDRCARVFDLAEDSGAAEILSDTVKAWLDPEVFGSRVPILVWQRPARYSMKLSTASSATCSRGIVNNSDNHIMTLLIMARFQQVGRRKPPFARMQSGPSWSWNEAATAVIGAISSGTAAATGRSSIDAPAQKSLVIRWIRVLIRGSSSLSCVARRSLPTQAT